jgi:hypothetical protein
MPCRDALAINLMNEVVVKIIGKGLEFIVWISGFYQAIKAIIVMGCCMVFRRRLLA